MKEQNEQNEMKKAYETPSMIVLHLGTNRMLAASQTGEGNNPWD